MVLQHVFFGLPGITEHHQMICNDNKGDEYLLMMERNTKTRTGIDMKNRREIRRELGQIKMTLQDAPLQLTSYTDRSVQLNIGIQMIHFIFNKTPILRNLHYGSSPNLLESTNLASS